MLGCAGQSSLLGRVVHRFAPVMLALDARMHLVSKSGERSIQAGQMYNHDGIVYLTKRADESLPGSNSPDQWRHHGISETAAARLH